MYSIPVHCPACGTPLVPAIEVVGADEASAGEVMCPTCRDSVWVDEVTMRDLLEALEEAAIEFPGERS